MKNNIFRNLITNTSKNQKIAFVFLTIPFTVIIILLIVLNIINQPAVRINNLNKYTNKITNEQQKELGDSLWSVIKNSEESQKNDNKKIKDIIIRDGTFEETTDDDKNLISTFIIDIDSLKQTYRVSIVSHEDNQIQPGDINIECPGYTLMKYKETECHGTDTSNSSLELYLPYEDKIDDISFTVSEKYYLGSDEKYYEIKFNTCDNLLYLFNQAKNKVIDYLKSNNIETSELKFELYENVKTCQSF